MREVKCKICEELDDKEIMLKDGNRYVHYECSQKAYKEKKQKEDLYDYILKVHSIKVIPKGFYYLLADLRNGTIRRGGAVVKKNKEGYPYDTILATYKKYSGNIHYAIQNINFKGIMGMLKYSLAIVSDKVWIVEKDMKKVRARRREEERLFGKKSKTTTGITHKKQNDDDISGFID